MANRFWSHPIELAEEELESGLRREKLTRYLGMALSEIQRLATTVRRLRDFYRPVRQEMQPTDVYTPSCVMCSN